LKKDTNISTLSDTFNDLKRELKENEAREKQVKQNYSKYRDAQLKRKETI
jgi:hypothetical protein